MKAYIETGKIVGTHGIKGMVRIQPWSDSGEFLSNFKCFYLDDKGEKKLEVKSAKPHGNVVLASFKGVDTIEDAERLRGAVIYIDRKDVKLPEGRYFVSDLLGCTVFDTDSGEILGTITDISETGANDVWHITRDNREYLIPAIDDVLVSVDVEAEKVIIRPLKGIFDNED